MDEPFKSSQPHRRLAGLDPGSLIAQATRTEPVDEQTVEIEGIVLETSIGRGGMGTVYLGRQLSLDREVAIKVLSLELSADPLFLERLEREARLMARLRHPNIVGVHDFQKLADGGAAIVMEFVEGGSLRERMHAHPCGLPIAEALTIIDQIASGLHTAHSAGVIHRDIKPENVLLDHDGTARVTDFGLALPLLDASSRLTLSGTVAGTLDYMAPERLDGAAGDARQDIFALGVVAYELLTDRTPRGNFDAPHRIRAAVSRHISDAVMRALRPLADDRFSSVEAFRLALRKPGTSTRRYALIALAVIAAVPGAIAFFKADKPPVPVASPQAEPQPRPWRDALAGILVHEESLAGSWTYENGILTSTDQICVLRLETTMPDSYDVRMNFTRLTGRDSISLFFVANGDLACMDIDGWRDGLSGVQSIDGEDLRVGYGFRHSLQNGRSAELFVEVSPDEVRVSVDGQFKKAFAIKGRRLALVDPWKFNMRTRPIALGVASYQSSTRFERIEWRSR